MNAKAIIMMSLGMQYISTYNDHLPSLPQLLTAEGG